ncbi:hypothetical protein C8R43DRAFT_1083755 [Mycena crocata]|nr:hypothetical protein C8R43DRAFT_1083755 [Mycena crocata]
MPYVAAVVHETLRWNNVGAIAVPHFLAVEDEYKGYRIPANSIIYKLCPGRHMAISSLWISVASILATLDITKARDEQGHEVEPSSPLPFECTIKPRSQEAADLIRGTARLEAIATGENC